MNSFKDYFVVASGVRIENFNGSHWFYTEYNILKSYNIITTYQCKIRSPQTIKSYDNVHRQLSKDFNYINYIDEFDVTNIMEFLRGDKTFNGV